MAARYRISGKVALITLDNPPVNSLNHETRRGLVEALDRALVDPLADAIVICGAGRLFSAGGDLREFGTPAQHAYPDPDAVLTALERSVKPIVAAIHGACMGGALEIALACHHRVAAKGADIALPEVKLGLIPGAGGTQRLPRVLGLEAALNMIVTGTTLSSEVLASVPGQRLFDRVVDADPVEAACDLGIRAAQERRAGTPLPRVRDLTVSHPFGPAFLQFARRSVGGVPSPLRARLQAVEAVAASLTHELDAGLEREREIFRQLMAGGESKALRHVFLAEREAAKIPGVDTGSKPGPVLSVAVIGAGTMGVGIAQCILDAGIPVTLVERDEAALQRGVGAVRDGYEAQVKKGRLDSRMLESRMSLLRGTLEYADLAAVDLAIEAVCESLEVKSQVFRRLDSVLKPGAILASNTSTLDLDQIASCTGRPQDVVGMHFFSPAPAMRLLELVRGKNTAPAVLATCAALGRKLNKICIVSGVCDGFIGNRMFEQYFRQAGFLLDEGASPEQVDRAIERFGFAMGPFRVNDLAGNDVGWAIRQRRRKDLPSTRYSLTGDLIYEAGRYGQKCGAGWYDYLPGQRTALSSPEVAAVLQRHRESLGHPVRAIAEDEIVQRLVFALVNEGARILEEGIARRPSDIDLVYLNGYGFPLNRGGPMHYAEQLGFAGVVRQMRQFAANPLDDGEFWKPAAWLSIQAETT